MVHLEGMGLGVRFTRGTHPAFRDRAWVRTWPEGRLRTPALFSFKEKGRGTQVTHGPPAYPEERIPKPLCLQKIKLKLKIKF